MKTKAFFFVAIFLAQSLAGFPTVCTAGNLPQGDTHHKILKASEDAQEVSPLTLAAENRNELSELDKIETEYDVFTVNMPELRQITRSARESMIMKVPGSTRDRDLDLVLVKADVFTPDFRLTLASGGIAGDIDLGLHYRGIINGDENSLVAISVFEDEVMGLIASDEGNFVLGKLRGPGWNNEHVLYDDRKVLKEGLECGTPDDGIGYTMEELEFDGTYKSIGDCIRFYIEADYTFYNYWGLQNTTNYVTGLLNQVIALFNQENIATAVSEIYIWDVPSPYPWDTGGSSSDFLTAFQQNTDAINGDLGQLISWSGSGGKAAGFNGICNPNVDQSLCYSNVGMSYEVVPTYSKSVMFVTHEFGHLFGSRHTHACVWNGDNTAIDGCSGSTEGTCPLPGIPPEGGTIMSYCHLTAAGINFNLGFGPQPGNVIRNNVVNATCTSPCGPASCSDNVQNGLETGVDCGGPDCAPCPCEPVTEGFPVNPLTHSGPGSGSATLDFGSPAHQDVSFILSDMNAKLNGQPSKKYIEFVTVTYNDGTSTQTYGTFYGDQQSSAYIHIPGTVAWVSVSLADSYDDGSTNSTMSIAFSPVSSCGDDAGGCPDADGDGVCDADDICPGYDDNIDSDGDGIPDGCDSDCVPVSNDFPTDPLTHSGPGSSSTSYNYGTPGHTDVSFDISGLNAKINGNPNNRYIELVSVTYTDAGGTQTYGTFSGANTSSVNVDIAGPVYSVTVTLEDGQDGNSPVSLSVDPGSISSCPPVGALPGAGDKDAERFDNMSEILVYPNPAKNVLNIDLGTKLVMKDGRISLVSIQGLVIKAVQFTEGSRDIRISTSGVAPGMYWIQIAEDGRVIAARKVVIAR